ncbi:copper resistance protein B [Pseudomonas delhiensis]|uniref:Copper resistance protein B n=1 Tax=Pseudomonas delhiensis TaxID=366289 RepID=A0A239JV46_9PSED|nr:copper resistance protein B [Pseudomonas delhiensis]SDJ98484.1 copper resistance protein B [Pseudomonas delhiensis]SNT09243.1 copper resistance protein B [Pseudomonas delhiensis]
MKTVAKVACLAALGLALPVEGAEMDDMPLGSLLLQRLESRFHGNAASLAWEAQGWYGTDYRKLRLKAEGERDAGGPTTDNEVQLLYQRLVADFWDLQAGVRHDDQPGPSRSYAVLGVQGLAPQWFEVDANLFLSERGDPSLRLESEYELLLSQRLVLQPSLEYNLALADDRATGVGAGGSELELGLRLRYEVRREFAPYVGYQWSKSYGRNGDIARAEGEKDEEGYWVAGIRLWF